MRQLLTVIVLLAGVCSPALAWEISLARAKQLLRSPDSHQRHETWKQLNPHESSHYRFLLSILRDGNWHDRDSAILALVKAAKDETLDMMVEDMKGHKSPFVRQGLAVAIAKMNNPKYYFHLYEMLEDKEPLVRRAVVYCLRINKKKDAVDALIKLFQTEKEPVTRSFIEHTLNDITQVYYGTDPLKWLAWWNVAKDDPDYKLGETDAEALAEAEKLGTKLKERKTSSVSAQVSFTTLERGTGGGAPILVIPFYNYSHEIMLPFLAELERNHKIFYIKLPPISSFEGLKAIGGWPYYPIDRLVDAFEDLRKETGQDRFALMACGMNSWIAMRYAKLHPESIAAMILVAPLSGNKEYRSATQRLKSTGEKARDREMWHLGMTREFNREDSKTLHQKWHEDNNVPEPEGEGQALSRRAWSLFFKDERDFVISALFDIRRHDMGRVAIPEFSLFTEKPPRLRIPTLVYVGTASQYTSVDDGKRIAKYYGGTPVVDKNSSCMPFAESSEMFNKQVGTFLKKYARTKKSFGKN